MQRELEVRRIEARPAGARERQALGEELARSGLAAPANASLEPCERQLPQLGREPGFHVGKDQIRDYFPRLAARVFEPHAKRTLAAPEVDRKR